MVLAVFTSADMVKADLPMLRVRQQIAEHAFGLDRQPIIAEDGVRNDGELCAMLAADNRHRGVVSTSAAGLG
jgi:SRSO17 transposase